MRAAALPMDRFFVNVVVASDVALLSRLVLFHSRSFGFSLQLPSINNQFADAEKSSVLPVLLINLLGVSYCRGYVQGVVLTQEPRISPCIIMTRVRVTKSWALSGTAISLVVPFLPSSSQYVLPN